MKKVLLLSLSIIGCTTNPIWVFKISCPGYYVGDGYHFEHTNAGYRFNDSIGGLRYLPIEAKCSAVLVRK